MLPVTERLQVRYVFSKTEQNRSESAFSHPADDCRADAIPIK